MVWTSGKSVKQIASELGVSVWNLGDWKECYAPKPPAIARTITGLEEQVENRASAIEPLIDAKQLIATGTP
ncbi:MAG: hypothetical protein H0X66_18555 [Verrucomicrobia bacterium]|nr:hypothetical protein [Verrucomicrobiota bacterium]